MTSKLQAPSGDTDKPLIKKKPRAALFRPKAETKRPQTHSPMFGSIVLRAHCFVNGYLLQELHFIRIEQNRAAQTG
jgi:hypothetical protein